MTPQLALEPFTYECGKSDRSLLQIRQGYPRYTSPDCDQDRSPYQDLADMVRRPSTAHQTADSSTGWVFKTSGIHLSSVNDHPIPTLPLNGIVTASEVSIGLFDRIRQTNTPLRFSTKASLPHSMNWWP